MLPSPKFKLSAVTSLLSDYMNRFSDLTAKPDLYRYYEKVISLVNGYNEIILDKQGVILTWNDGFRKMMGFEKQEIIGQCMSLLYLPDDRQHKKPDELLARALKYGTASCYGQFARKDGATFFGSLKVVAIKKREMHLGFTLSFRQKKHTVQKLPV